MMSFLDIIRRLSKRQKIRAHIRREQEQYLREHPELRIPPPITSLPKPGPPQDFAD